VNPPLDIRPLGTLPVVNVILARVTRITLGSKFYSQGNLANPKILILMKLYTNIEEVNR